MQLIRSFVKTNAVCFILLLLPALRTAAQHEHFRHILREEGLPSSYVHDAAADQKGYLWFATNKGIARYDGKIFKRYGPEDGFRDVGAYKIIKDGKGSLWFISHNFNLYRLQGERFQQHFPGESFSWFNDDKDGNLYAVTRGGWVVSFDEHHIVRHRKLGTPIGWHIQVLKSNGARIVIMQDSMFYMTDKTRLIHGIKKRGRLIRIYELKDHRVLMCNRDGVYQLDTATLETKLLLPMQNNEVYSYYEDSATKDLWLGTRQGAYQFRNGIITPGNYKKHLDVMVSAIFKNADGMLWFATYGDGIYISSFQSKAYTKEEEDLSSDEVAYIKKQDSLIYVIPFREGISVIRNGKIKRITEDLSDIYKGIIRSDGKRIFLITGKHYVELRNGEVRPIAYEEGSHYFMVYVDQAGQIYYGKGSRTYKYDNRKKQFYPFPDEQMQDLWTSLSTSLGLGSMSPYISDSAVLYPIYRGWIKVWRTGNKVQGAMDTSYPSGVTNILPLKTGSIIVATNNQGLDIMVKGKHHFYDIHSGMPSNSINAIYLDSCYLWACTSSGLVRLHLGKGDTVTKMTYFNSKNILVSDEVQDITIFNGYAYVATNKGVSVFNRSVEITNYKPPVDIQGLQVNDHDTSLNNGMVLPYYLNTITLSFRALTFSDQGIIYRYTLEGADNAYYTGSEERLKYNQLKPGSYVFKIWAKTANSGWSTTPATFSFTIAPPYWQTWWFISAVSFVFLFTLLVVMLAIIRANKRKQEMKRKISESELRAIRLHMNPHFIFNSLNSLQSYILSNRSLEASDYLAVFSKMIRLIMQYAQLKEISLKEELDFLAMYVELERIRFREHFDYKVRVDDDIDAELLFIPPLVIQPFIENAVKHGLSGKTGKGSIELTLKKQNNMLCCQVRDNGIGRKRVQEIRQQRIYTYTSTGIKFTQERLKLLSTIEHIGDYVVIDDLYDDQHNACGTLVTIYIPLNK